MPNSGVLQEAHANTPSPPPRAAYGTAAAFGRAAEDRIEVEALADMQTSRQ